MGLLSMTSCKKENLCNNCSSGNILLIAMAGHDQVISLPTNSVILDGSGSISEGNEIKKIHWEMIEGPTSYAIENPASAKTVVTKLIKGVYHFQLEVTNMAELKDKDTVIVTVTGTVSSTICANRPITEATLIPFANLSEARFGLVGASAGTKLVFASGWTPGAHSSRVDIYDTINKSWSTAELTVAERDGMAVVTVGNKILFAGGGNNDWIDVTSRVDIYDAVSNSWSIAELSQPRNYPAAITLGNKVYIAGGGYWGPLTPGSSTNYHIGSVVVDVYDNATDSWTTSKLSEGRFELSATVVNNKIYFAGGLQSIYTASSQIDVYDASTGNWSYTKMQTPRTGHAGVNVEDKIMWAGGATSPYMSGYKLAENAEIRDLKTGTSTMECFIPKSLVRTIRINDQILFYAGVATDAKNHFDLYDISDQQWKTVVLPIDLEGAAIVSVNNNIYVAGGSIDGVYTNKVWKMEF